METRRKRFVRAFSALALLMVSALPANGITWGEPDTSDAYPAVGAIMIDWRVIDRPEFGLGVYCSGTLIHPLVFLTAGHCADGLVEDGIIDSNGFPIPGDDNEADIWVSFDENPTDFHPPETKTRCDTCLDIVRVVNSPLYRWGPVSDPHDIAAIILAEPSSITPMPYAGLGELEDLRGSTGRRNGAIPRKLHGCWIWRELRRRAATVGDRISRPSGDRAELISKPVGCMAARVPAPIER